MPPDPDLALQPERRDIHPELLNGGVIGQVLQLHGPAARRCRIRICGRAALSPAAPPRLGLGLGGVHRQPINGLGLGLGLGLGQLASVGRTSSGTALSRCGSVSVSPGTGSGATATSSRSASCSSAVSVSGSGCGRCHLPLRGAPGGLPAQVIQRPSGSEIAETTAPVSPTPRHHQPLQLAGVDSGLVPPLQRSGWLAPRLISEGLISVMRGPSSSPSPGQLTPERLSRDRTIRCSLISEPLK